MRTGRMGRPAGLVVAIVIAAVMLAGCVPGGGKRAAMDAVNAKDTAGMTRAEVAKLTLEEEFTLYGQRYEQMQKLLEEAQLQITDGIWYWVGGDSLPMSGGSGGIGGGLPGSNDKNSYYLTAARIINPEGATGARSDLDPMIAYFEAKGWDSRIHDVTVPDVAADYHLLGETGDGWQIEYAVQDNGQYALSVYSELFWTNDPNALLHAIGQRDSDDFPEESLPGVFEPFPKWDDPILE